MQGGQEYEAPRCIGHLRLNMPLGSKETGVGGLGLTRERGRILVEEKANSCRTTQKLVHRMKINKQALLDFFLLHLIV